MHGGDVSKWNLKEFTIASNKIQHIVIRNSKLAGLRKSASRWPKLGQENHSYCPSSKEFERYIWKMGFSHWTNKEEMHQWNSGQTSEKHWQICTVSTVNLEKSDLKQLLFINTKGGIRRLLHPVPHGGSGMNTDGAPKINECQLPLSSWNEQHQRTGRLVLDAYSSRYLEWNNCDNIFLKKWL